MFRDDQAVVIDYKFGVKQNPVHVKQVKEYLKQIRKMKYNHTTGYIWYVNQNWIKKVE
jgi:CRISPR/Cas system-associated exonuclease Cas4 (RecB family)